MDIRYNDDNDLHWIIVRTWMRCYCNKENDLEWELDEEFDEDWSILSRR